MARVWVASLRSRRVGRAWLLAMLLLIGSGIAYRALAVRLQILLARPIELPVPLKEFPLQINDWHGEDQPIREVTKEYMERFFADDYLNRRYINTKIRQSADVYLVYCASRPAGILGHRPRVCYPAHGFVHDGTETTQFQTQSGRTIDCLFHRFHQPGLGGEQVVVLSFYIVNGQVTTDESMFSSFWGRRPNLVGDPARYVVQVQISSAVQQSVLSAAQDLTDKILEFLPKDQKDVLPANAGIHNKECHPSAGLSPPRRRGQGPESKGQVKFCPGKYKT